MNLSRPKTPTAALFLAIAVAGPVCAQQGDVKGRVVIVTSFNKQVTAPFKSAFEKAHPGVTVDVQNRNTNAGVRYLAETKTNNRSDIFWASAPDAFEVLKRDGLLEKYAPKASGIAARTRSMMPTKGRSSTFSPAFPPPPSTRSTSSKPPSAFATFSTGAWSAGS